MTRNGDAQAVTWQQVAGVTTIIVALVGTVIQVSNAAEETKDAIVTSEKVQEVKLEVHDDDELAHEAMRRMFMKELKPIKDDTQAIKQMLEDMAE